MIRSSPSSLVDALALLSLTSTSKNIITDSRNPSEQDPAAYEQLIKNAEHFVSQRFLPRLLSVRPDPVVHLVKAEVDADSIGSVVCRKAKDLGAAALVMASHTKSKLQEFFLGSVTNYCCHHCSAPVLVVK